MSHPLERIAISGFKSIARADIELGPINVVIGANGAGKSNFVEVFDMLRELVERRLQSYVARSGGADALLHFGRKRTSRIEFELGFDPNGYKVVLEAAAGDELFFESEEIRFFGYGHLKRWKESLGAGHEESKLREEAQRNPGRVASYVLGSIQSWRRYHFHDTSESARVKQKGDIDDNATLRFDASNLAAFLYRLQNQHENAYRRIVATVRSVAPFFDDFALRADPANSRRIQLEWRETGERRLLQRERALGRHAAVHLPRHPAAPA